MSVAETWTAERPATLAEALALGARTPHAGVRFLDRREGESWIPWSVVRERALAVAGGLRQLGVRTGDRVGLVYPTSAAFLEAFFGTVLAGAVPAAVHPPPPFGRLDDYERRAAAMLEGIDARLVLADGRGARRLHGSSAARRPLGCRSLAELPQGSAGAEAIDAVPGDLAMVQFSSGTTVAPKPVALSHRSVLSQARMLNALWPDTAEVRHSGLSWLPLYHDMGLIGCVFPALERPGELTLIPPEVFAARPAIWLRSLSRFGATVSPGTNFAYAYCVDRIADDELQGVDLGRWRVALNGAEPVTPEVMRRFSRRFARWGFRAAALTPVYGLAEAALAVTFSGIDEPFSSERFDRLRLGEGGVAVASPGGLEITSVGRPVPGFELSIRDGRGSSVPDGRVGRIWTRGPSLMEGYLGSPQATAEVLRDGWLDTGDLGFLHRGELYVTGRAKDLIIVRGRNYPPEEIELAVGRLAGVQTGGAAAVGHLPEGAEREEVVLFVERCRRVRDGDRHRLAEDCRSRVRAAVGIDVDRVVVLRPDALPRTSSGKIRRGEALGRYLAAELWIEVELGPHDNRFDAG